MSKFVKEKYDKEEPIKSGDLIAYWPQSDKVTRAILKNWKDSEDNRVIGICTNVDKNNIQITNSGIAEVNVTGLICLGDRLSVCEKPGIAKAIRYSQDETKFRYRHIGKVIELYNRYDRVKVLLDIE